MTTAYAPAPTAPTVPDDGGALCRVMFGMHTAAVLHTAPVDARELRRVAARAWASCPYPAATLGRCEWAAVLRRCGYIGARGELLPRPAELVLYRGGSALEDASAQPGYVPTAGELAQVLADYPTGPALQRELQAVAAAFTGGDVLAAWRMFPPEGYPLGWGMSWCTSAADAERHAGAQGVVYAATVPGACLLADLGGHGLVVDTGHPAWPGRAVRVLP